jgi:hypothetical protein
MLPPTPSASPDGSGPWWALAALGAFHGLNPGMGWLFALAWGLQQGRPGAVARATVPIVLGHAAAIAAVAAVVGLAGAVWPESSLRWAVGVAVLAFGLYRLVRWARHPRWVGLRVSERELFLWSFLVASAHGAGVMVAPVWLALTAAGEDGPVSAEAWARGAAGLAVHTASLWATMGATAWVVHRKFGLGVLRRAWINFDLVWAVALVAVGALTLAGAALGRAGS